MKSTGKIVCLLSLTGLIVAGSTACGEPTAEIKVIHETESLTGLPSEWHEFKAFHSKELPPPVVALEGQYYNQEKFSNRPLMQDFTFFTDKDWRFVMTAEGLPNTVFEVHVAVTLPGEPVPRYHTAQVFSLHSAPLSIMWEESLEEANAPTADVEVKVFFDKPMDWTMRIEK